MEPSVATFYSFATFKKFQAKSKLVLKIGSFLVIFIHPLLPNLIGMALTYKNLLEHHKLPHKKKAWNFASSLMLSHTHTHTHLLPCLLLLITYCCSLL